VAQTQVRSDFPIKFWDYLSRLLKKQHHRPPPPSSPHHHLHPFRSLSIQLSAIMANNTAPKADDPMAGLVHSEAHYFNRYE
jgi:hypothetical protein